MEKVINYAHFPGGSCACVAWSGVFREHGYNFSEADIFGLGSGVFFGFCAIGASKFFDVCLTSHSIVDDLLINTGVHGKLLQYSDSNKCLNEIIESLDRGFPVAVQLNPFFCDGLIKVTSFDLQKHLPAHWVIITGYNLVDKTLTYYDNRQFNSVNITFDRFTLARNSGVNDQNPRNFFYSVFFYEKLYPIEYAMRLSLRKACIGFSDIRKIQAFYTGSYGFDKLIRQIALWNVLLEPEPLVDLIKKIKLSITGGGGIKGGYRRLFSDYLASVSTVIKNDNLQHASMLFKESASSWNILIQELTSCALQPHDKRFWGPNSSLASILEDIRKYEHQGFNIIRETI